jgi:Ca-activated chloride channel family protein
MNSPDRQLLIACRRLRCSTVWFLLSLLAISLPASASLFKTPEQDAAGKFEDGDYTAAASEFSDNYRRGVALYRAGRYKDAGEAFASVKREDVKADALYNLGNTRYKQGDYPGAIDAYQQSLKLRVNDEDTLHNLGLAKKMVELSTTEEITEEKKDQPKEKQESEKKKSEDQKKESEQKKSEDQKKESEQKKSEDQKKESEEKKSGDQKKESEEKKSGDQKKESEEKKSGDQKKESEEKKSGDQKKESEEKKSGDQQKESEEKKSGDQESEGESGKKDQESKGESEKQDSEGTSGKQDKESEGT